jgi:hypothetical protein
MVTAHLAQAGITKSHFGRMSGYGANRLSVCSEPWFQSISVDFLQRQIKQLMPYLLTSEFGIFQN